jgi:metal-responsive CopG/Arc/MetJ family transcriptional regulator
MRNAVTISLPLELARELNASAKRRGLTRSAVVKEALKHDLFRDHLKDARALAVAAARRQGLYSDEDIFKAVS